MIVFYYLFLFLHVLVAILLCGIILIQENRSLGLGAAFGGDSSTSLFGTDTASVVKKATAWLAGIFFVGCVILSLWTSVLSVRPSSSSENFVTESGIER